jgi:hypothetical protein
MEIFTGGHIYIDENDSDCSNPQFDTSKELSDYGGTAARNKASFVTNGKAGKLSGDLFVVQGDTGDSIKVSKLSVGQRQFQYNVDNIHITLPTLGGDVGMRNIIWEHTECSILNISLHLVIV